MSWYEHYKEWIQPIAPIIPKQFILINDKPIIIYTIEKFLNVSEIDQIIVAVVKDYLDYTRELIDTYLDTDKVTVIEGGKNRSESLLNVCSFIGYNSSDILVSHDACRPFVSESVIEENIMLLNQYDAVGTFIPSVDTLAVFKDGILADVPMRTNLFNVQTPQTFRVKDFVCCYYNLFSYDREKLTDASKVFLLNGKRVGMVIGDPSNIKITNPLDLEYASLILGRQKKLERKSYIKKDNEEM